jgi:hypothetical protein
MLFYVFWIALLTASVTIATEATWKPEYAKSPSAVTAWFKEARVGGCDNSQKAKAWNRLGVCGCCEHADRLKTKFVANAEGDWSYYPDPKCTTKECSLKAIPNDIVHQDGIHRRFICEEDRGWAALDPKKRCSFRPVGRPQNSLKS